MKIRIINNLDEDLKKSINKWHRVNRLRFGIRRNYVNQSANIHNANNQLYTNVKNLYFATFASVIAIFASVFPYLFSSDCQHLYGLNKIKTSIMTCGLLYLMSFFTMIIFHSIKTIMTTATFIVMPILSTQGLKKARKSIDDKPSIDATERLSAIGTIVALSLWIYTTVFVIKTTIEITTDSKLVEYSKQTIDACKK